MNQIIPSSHLSFPMLTVLEMGDHSAINENGKVNSFLKWKIIVCLGRVLRTMLLFLFFFGGGGGARKFD